MKIFVVDKYTIIICALIVLLVAVMLPVSMSDIVPASAGQKELPIYSVATDKKVVAISFDCAWSADDIPSIAKTLSDYNCKASFFVVGDWAQKYPNEVKQLFDAGHDIAGHSFNHAHYNKMTVDELKADMDKADAVIKSITGKKLDIVRSPYGEYNNNVIKACRESGRFCIQWDVDSLDWKDLTKEQMIERIMARVKNGSIILLHNGTKNTADALPSIMQALKDEGFTFVKVSDLIMREGFTIDHEGRQQKS